MALRSSGTCCAARGCTNNQTKLNLWFKERCVEHGPLTKRECSCPPRYRFYRLPSEDEARRMWLKNLNLEKPPKTLYVCSFHFVDKVPTEDNPYPTLWLGNSRPPEKKKRRRVLQRPDSSVTRAGAPQLHVCKDEVEEKECGIRLDHEEPEPPHIKEEKELLLKQEIKSEDLSEKHIYEEETEAEHLLWKQESRSSLDEEESEIPQIKEEWEEVCISVKGEQLELKQETDAFMVTENDQESLNSKQKPSESPVLEDHTYIRNSDAVTVQHDPLSHESLDSCGTCGKVFTQPCNLKAHMKTHTFEKPCICKMCGKKFSRFKYLSNHMRIHENQCSCGTCGKSFTASSKLTLHVKSQMCKKPFVCESFHP